MMRFLLAICFLGAILSTTSCDNQVKAERLKRIDSLGTHLNHVAEVVGKVDSQLIENRLVDINRTGNWLLENADDTLDPKPGIIFGDFLRCKKFFNKSIDRYRNVKRELAYSEKQLNTLRSDVKNSFYSDEEFNGYFSTEASSVAALVDASDELEQTYGSVTERYSIMKPRVQLIIDSIKSVIFSPEAK